MHVMFQLRCVLSQWWSSGSSFFLLAYQFVKHTGLANETCQHSFVTHAVLSLTALIYWQLMNAVRVGTDVLWHDQHVLDEKKLLFW